MALPTKQQESPRGIKFLQERLDHSWDVHDIGQVLRPCAQPRSPAPESDK